MKTLSWNIREIGKPQTVRDLNRLVRDQKPFVIFLLETKILKYSVDQVK